MKNQQHTTNKGEKAMKRVTWDIGDNWVGRGERGQKAIIVVLSTCFECHHRDIDGNYTVSRHDSLATAINHAEILLRSE